MIEHEKVIKELLDLGFTIVTESHPPRVHYQLFHSGHTTTKLPVMTVYGTVQLKQLLNAIRVCRTSLLTLQPDTTEHIHQPPSYYEPIGE